MKLKIIHLVLIAIALSLPLWLTPGSLTVKPFGPADVSRLLAFPLLVALFLERALEVFVNTWRDPQAEKLDLEVKDAQAKLTAAPADGSAISAVKTASQKQIDYRSDTRRMALWSALVMGLVVSAVGVRTLQALVDSASLQSLGTYQRDAFLLLDVFLTGGLIAGGSEGIHKLTQVYSDFMDATSQKVKSQNG
jgi:hypothetical protein